MEIFGWMSSRPFDSHAQSDEHPPRILLLGKLGNRLSRTFFSTVFFKGICFFISEVIGDSRLWRMYVTRSCPDDLEGKKRRLTGAKKFGYRRKTVMENTHFCIQHIINLEKISYWCMILEYCSRPTSR